MARGDQEAQARERSAMRRRVAELCDALSELPAIDCSDPDQIDERCRLQFRMCMDADVMPTLGTLSIALGCTCDDLRNIGRSHSGRLGRARLTNETAEVLRKNLAKLEGVFNANFENGNYPQPVAGIFAAKNNYGWTDTREVHELVVHAEVTPEQVAERYQAAIPMHVNENGEVHMLQDGQRAVSAAKIATALAGRIEQGDFETA